MTKSDNRTIEDNLAVAAEEAARRAGIGRTTLYQAMKSGGLKYIKIGKRRLIAIKTLEAWLAAHEVG